jgi:hypothetical protein
LIKEEDEDIDEDVNMFIKFLDLFNFNNKYFKKLNHLIFLTKVRK